MNLKSKEFKFVVIGTVAILFFSLVYFFVLTEEPTEKKDEQVKEEVIR